MVFWIHEGTQRFMEGKAVNRTMIATTLAHFALRFGVSFRQRFEVYSNLQNYKSKGNKFVTYFQVYDYSRLPQTHFL